MVNRSTDKKIEKKTVCLCKREREKRERKRKTESERDIKRYRETIRETERER